MNTQKTSLQQNETAIQGYPSHQSVAKNKNRSVTFSSRTKKKNVSFFIKIKTLQQNQNRGGLGRLTGTLISLTGREAKSSLTEMVTLSLSSISVFFRGETEIETEHGF